MAKRGGFPGGGMPGNMANLMKQAQKMQRQMEEQQKELETKEFTAAAGGGAVEVTVSGKREVTKVKLAEEVVDPDDIEMLEDLIVAATNEALRQVEQETNAAVSKMTGEMCIRDRLPVDELHYFVAASSMRPIIVAIGSCCPELCIAFMNCSRFSYRLSLIHI